MSPPRPDGKSLPQHEASTRTATIRGASEGFARTYLDPNQDRNPLWDSRIRRESGAGGRTLAAGLQRGYITQLEREVFPMAGANGLKQRRVEFMYNPTAISLGYGIDTSVLPPDTKSRADTGPVWATSSMTISFELYLNRTYEVASDKSGTFMGVMADIQAMEYMLGSYDGLGMQALSVLVVFGASRSGKPFAFAGHFSDMSFSIVQFSNRMVPTVATAQVGLVRRFISEQPQGGPEDNPNFTETLSRAAATVGRTIAPGKFAPQGSGSGGGGGGGIVRYA